MKITQIQINLGRIRLRDLQIEFNWVRCVFLHIYIIYQTNLSQKPFIFYRFTDNYSLTTSDRPWLHFENFPLHISFVTYILGGLGNPARLLPASTLHNQPIKSLICIINIEINILLPSIHLLS